MLHVIALLVAAVPLHLVAAREPALQPLGPGPLDRHGNVARGGKFTPVEDIEPFCSFTVTQRVHNVAIVQVCCCLLLFVNFCHFIVRLDVNASNLKAVIPECR